MSFFGFHKTKNVKIFTFYLRYTITANDLMLSCLLSTVYSHFLTWSVQTNVKTRAPQRTNKRGSHEDDVGAQAERVDLPGVLWSLQHLDVIQLHAGHVETLCSKGQTTTLFISNAAQWSAATITVLIQSYTGKVWRVLVYDSVTSSVAVISCR